MAWDRPPPCQQGDPYAAPFYDKRPSAAEEAKALQAGQWDLSPTPLLLAGSDGNVHETRPTANLARQLAEADCEQAPLPAATVGHSRRSSLSENRPRTADSFASSAGSQRRSSLADRPVSGFSGADRPVCGFSGGPTTIQSEPRIRRKSPPPAAAGGSSPSNVAAGPRSPGAAGGSSPSNIAAGSRSPGGLGQRRSLRTYAPINALLSMGFSEDSARVAMVAAGGDIDRAINLILQDACAHGARTGGEWEFEGDSGWAPFDCDTETAVRDALVRGVSTVEVKCAGHKYLIDLDNHTQMNMVTKRSRRIRRRDSKSASGSGSASAPAS